MEPWIQQPVFSSRSQVKHFAPNGESDLVAMSLRSCSVESGAACFLLLLSILRIGERKGKSHNHYENEASEFDKKRM